MRALSSIAILRDGVLNLIAGNGRIYKLKPSKNIETGDTVWIYINEQHEIKGIEPTYHDETLVEPHFDEPLQYDMDHEDDIYHLSDNDMIIDN